MKTMKYQIFSRIGAPSSAPESPRLRIQKAFLLLALVLSTPTWAQQAEVFSASGLAIRGYDPVAYFSEQKPVAGNPTFSYEWQGATWHFANAENAELFAASPERYAPQYGGYCAYAVANGYTASTDPGAWHIHEDKLYLNYNRTVRLLWRRDIPGNIVSANGNWPQVLRK